MLERWLTDTIMFGLLSLKYWTREKKDLRLKIARGGMHVAMFSVAFVCGAGTTPGSSRGGAVGSSGAGPTRRPRTVSPAPATPAGVSDRPQTGAGVSDPPQRPAGVPGLRRRRLASPARRRCSRSRRRGRGVSRTRSPLGVGPSPSRAATSAELQAWACAGVWCWCVIHPEPGAWSCANGRFCMGACLVPAWVKIGGLCVFCLLPCLGRNHVCAYAGSGTLLEKYCSIF